MKTTMIFILLVWLSFAVIAANLSPVQRMITHCAEKGADEQSVLFLARPEYQLKITCERIN